MIFDQDIMSEDFGLPVHQTPVKQDSCGEDYASFKFTLAPGNDKYGFTEDLKASKGKERKMLNFNKGTTTLAFKFQGGVLVAVDSRASMGSFNNSELVRKVIEIDDQILGTMAGGAADCQFWEAHLGNYCREYHLKYGEKLSVAAAAQYLTNICYKYRSSGLSMGCMLAGNDSTGRQLYYIDNEGNKLKGDIFSVGSGSTYAYGILDNYYRWDMTLDEAVQLGKRAISEAVHNDAGSGGVVRVYHVHEQGWTKIHEGINLNGLIWDHRKQMGRDQDVEGKLI